MNAAVIPIIVVVGAFISQYVFVSRHDWKCGNCGAVFSLSPMTASFLPHSFPMRKLTTCPSCGQRTWVSAVPKQHQDQH